jgi:hypothetical protein
MAGAAFLTTQNELGHGRAAPQTLVEFHMNGDDRPAGVPEQIIDTQVGEHIE